MPSPFHATTVALLVLTACATPASPSNGAAPAASTKPAASATASSSPTVVCEEEADTGSHISRRRCRPVERVDQQRETTQVELTKPRPTPPPAGN